MDARPTRRELVVGAAAAVGAGIGAGVVAGPTVADTPAPSDAELLGDALVVERLMVLAYRRVLDSGALSPGVRRAIAPHLSHEIAHLAAVAARLRQLGAPAPTGPLDQKSAKAAMARHHVSDSLT